MLMGINIIAILKYALAICILVCIVIAPAYLAAANGRDKYDKMLTRCGSLLFSWSFVGWIVALFIASKK